MRRIGACEAKREFTQLLEDVAKGERITITKHGVPVATLQPVNPSRKVPVKEIIEHLKRFRSEHPLNGLTFRGMIEQGRR